MPAAHELWHVGPLPPPRPREAQHTVFPVQFCELVHATANVPIGQAPGSAHELPASPPPAPPKQHTCGAVHVSAAQGIIPVVLEPLLLPPPLLLPAPLLLLVPAPLLLPLAPLLPFLPPLLLLLLLAPTPPPSVSPELFVDPPQAAPMQIEISENTQTRCFLMNWPRLLMGARNCP
jgi:hypothetical protein